MKFDVTITETLKLAVKVEAEDQHAAEQIVSDNWKKSEYILDADNFVGVEFEADAENGGSYQCCRHDTPRTFDWCENNCDRYYSCDTVAWAGDELNEDEAGGDKDGK